MFSEVLVGQYTEKMHFTQQRRSLFMQCTCQHLMVSKEYVALSEITGQSAHGCWKVYRQIKQGAKKML